MESEFSIFIALAAIAFCVALLAVVTQWLKADDEAAATEIGIQVSLKSLDRSSETLTEQPLQLSAVADTMDHAIPADRRTAERPAPAAVTDAEAESVYHLPALEIENPEQLSDDTTSLSRLFFGWGLGGMAVGLGLGAAMYGFVGALLGGIVLSAASIGAVVVVVALLDRSRARARAAQARSR